MKYLKKSSHLILLVLSIILFTCEKEDLKNEPIVVNENKNSIKVITKDKVEDIELEHHIENSLSIIKKIFDVNIKNFQNKIFQQNTRNHKDTIIDIKIKTDAFTVIESDNGKKSYTFQIEYPSDKIDNNEIVNLLSYYNENNELNSILIKYEFSNEELIKATENQSLDGLWDKISFINLQNIDIKNTKTTKNNSIAYRHECDGIFNCDPGSYTTWTPQPNSSGYGGSSGPGSSYTLPPLSTLPPSVIATLLAAGVITNTSGIAIYPNPNGPYTPSYTTTPVTHFSVNDIRIPLINSNNAIPYNYFYTYTNFTGLKNVIKTYYERVYIPQLNSYLTLSQTSIQDHVKKQKVIYGFFQFIYAIKENDIVSYNYLGNNPQLTEDIFYFLAEKNNSFTDYLEAQNFAHATIDDFMEDTEIDYPGNNLGYPYRWWLDNNFIVNSGNFDIDDEKPNAKEAALFAIFRNQAILHMENSVVALSKAEELVTNGVLTGIGDGKADAFRHAFWNALGTAEFGSYIMKLFADAHEWGQTPGDSVDMDFHNNHEGRNIGEGFDFFSSDDDISDGILQAITNGTLKYINSSGVLVYTNQ